MSAGATSARRARVRALAKVNLDLRVLGQRRDGFHELRTIFQTISLADTLDIAFTPGRRSSIEIEDALDIPDNLAVRAAPRLCEMASELGSDVPFFLLGGRAAGIGRGQELLPLPETAAPTGVLVVPGVPVSTAQAYRWLSAHLTTESQQNKIFSFIAQAWAQGAGEAGCNDFEAVVFQHLPQLAALKKRLEQAGASPALMTGSGSAIFGLFRTGAQARRALAALEEENAFRISLVSRARYRAMWWRALKEHIAERIWPPQSRYAL